MRFLIQKNDERYDELAAAAEQAIRELAAHGRPPAKLTLGERVADLERQVAGMLGARHCVFLTNATAGLEIAYRYANLAKGDEVIVPAITFIATIAYPLAVGARVVFADVDPGTLNLDPADVERKLTRRTRVIVPVHLGGRPVDMDPLMELARRRGILVVEDAAHAFGALYKGRQAGTIGHFGAFSFHEKKNVNSFGEGGILVTSLPLGEKLRQARFLGLDSSRKPAGWIYDVVALEGERGPFVAGNASSTEIQAVGLSVQLRRMERILEERRRAAEYLSGRFAASPALIPEPPDTADFRSTHHLYLLQVNPRGGRGRAEPQGGAGGPRGGQHPPLRAAVQVRAAAPSGLQPAFLRALLPCGGGGLPAALHPPAPARPAGGPAGRPGRRRAGGGRRTVSPAAVIVPAAP